MDGKKGKHTSRGLHVESPDFNKIGERVLVSFETKKENIKNPGAHNIEIKSVSNINLN